MLKMLKRFVGPGVAVILATVFALSGMPTHATAGDRPPANDVGRFFGMSLSCGCLAQDEKFLTAFYYAVFAEDFDQSYADNMVGEMRYYANRVWRNQASLCSSVCQSEYMTMMGDIVDDADMAMASPVFESYFNEAYERYFGVSVASGGDQETVYYDLADERINSDLSYCRSQPSRPECRNH